MGVVTEVEIGSDGLVGTVSIQISTGVVRRDIRKVCLMEGVE